MQNDTTVWYRHVRVVRVARGRREESKESKIASEGRLCHLATRLDPDDAHATPSPSSAPSQQPVVSEALDKETYSKSIRVGSSFNHADADGKCLLVKTCRASAEPPQS